MVLWTGLLHSIPLTKAHFWGAFWITFNFNLMDIMDILTHQVSLFALATRGLHIKSTSFFNYCTGSSDTLLFINLTPQLFSFAPISSI